MLRCLDGSRETGTGDGRVGEEAEEVLDREVDESGSVDADRVGEIDVGGSGGGGRDIGAARSALAVEVGVGEDVVVRDGDLTVACDGDAVSETEGRGSGGEEGVARDLASEGAVLGRVVVSPNHASKRDADLHH